MSTTEEQPVVAVAQPEKKPPKKPKKQKAAKRKRAEQAAGGNATSGDSLETPSKRAKTANTSDSTETKKAEPAIDPAIEYLHQWKNDQDSWKFKKLKDIWLVQHVYDLSKVRRARLNFVFFSLQMIYFLLRFI
jgi:hypothetical protein